MPAAYRTDKGRVRADNEDALLADEKNGIFILADGLGGHQAGEVASSLAVEEVHTYLKDMLGAHAAAGSLPGLVTEAILRANLVVHRKSEADPGLTGMGTTLIVAVVRDDEACIGHVGDSRAYLMRERLEQITKNHTISGYLLMPARRSHILAQAVGTSEDIAPEIHRLELREGDIMLLCSDGLTDMLSAGEIEGIIRTHGDDMKSAADALVEEANRTGGFDNISVILIKK